VACRVEAGETRKRARGVARESTPRAEATAARTARGVPGPLDRARARVWRDTFHRFNDETTSQDLSFITENVCDAMFATQSSPDTHHTLNHTYITRHYTSTR